MECIAFITGMMIGCLLGMACGALIATGLLGDEDTEHDNI